MDVIHLLPSSQYRFEAVRIRSRCTFGVADYYFLEALLRKHEIERGKKFIVTNR